MALGQVKWFDDAKGFGFIKPQDGKKDIFVHHTGIAGKGYRSLTENDSVEYELEESPKGPRAVNVRKA